MSAFERVLHTLLTLLFGVVLMALAPWLAAWLVLPTAVVPTTHGAFSVAFSMFAAGMAAWGLRDGLASLAALPSRRMGSRSHRRCRNRSGRAVLVGGATGFIGAHLVRALRRRGDAVWVWTRDADRALERFGPQVHS